MKLVALSISKYRSIVAAPRVEFSQYTVLLGPNNEGKSNVIRALVTAMEVLSRHGRFRGTATLRPSSAKNQSGPAQYATRLLAPDYDWARDFPVQLQDRQPNGKSTFTLEFDLSPDEIAEFRAEIGSSLNGVLPVKLSISSNTCEIKVVKRGRGGSALTKKSSAVARFISSRIDLQYIPAVRTARRAIDVVGEMVSTELATIEEHPEYLAALAKLE